MPGAQWAVVSTGLHPGGIRGSPTRQEFWRCGRVYPEPNASVTTTEECDAHRVFAMGHCARCGENPVCGWCRNRTCSACHRQEALETQARQAEERKKAHIDKKAADEAEAARSRAHAARRDARRAEHGGRDAIIKRLRAEHARVGSFTRFGGFTYAVVFYLLTMLAALIVGGLTSFVGGPLLGVPETRSRAAWNNSWWFYYPAAALEMAPRLWFMYRLASSEDRFGKRMRRRDQVAQQLTCGDPECDPCSASVAVTIRGL